jgi:hypothetical protein
VSLNLDVIAKLGGSLLITFSIDNVASRTLGGVSSPSNGFSIEFLSKGFGIFAAAAVLTSLSKLISLSPRCSRLRLFLLLLLWDCED